MPSFEAWPVVVGPILLIVALTLLALRGARLFVHGIVKALLPRDTAEGTAEELPTGAPRVE